MTRIVSMIVMNIVTSKAAAKLELSFNISASGKIVMPNVCFALILVLCFLGYFLKYFINFGEYRSLNLIGKL